MLGRWASERVRAGHRGEPRAARRPLRRVEGARAPIHDAGLGRARRGAAPRRPATSTRTTGATWFRSTAFGDDKDRVVIRSNGKPTYFAADIGYVTEKFSRGFDELIYIWGADHHGTVARQPTPPQALGYDRRRSPHAAHRLGALRPRRRGDPDEQAVRRVHHARRAARRGRGRRRRAGSSARGPTRRASTSTSSSRRSRATRTPSTTCSTPMPARPRSCATPPRTASRPDATAQVSCSSTRRSRPWSAISSTSPTRWPPPRSAARRTRCRATPTSWPAAFSAVLPRLQGAHRWTRRSRRRGLALVDATRSRAGQRPRPAGDLRPRHPCSPRQPFAASHRPPQQLLARGVDDEDLVVRRPRRTSAGKGKRADHGLGRPAANSPRRPACPRPARQETANVVVRARWR